MASVPVSSEDAAKALGEKIDVVLGISDEKLYVAAGRDALKLLKDAIAKSKAAAGKEVPPMQLSIAATPIAKFMAEVAEGPAKMMATMAAGMFEKSAGKDHVTITSRPVDNGVNTRLEVEEGLLKLVSLAQAPRAWRDRAAGRMGPGGMPVPEPSSGKQPEKKPEKKNHGDKEPSPF